MTHVPPVRSFPVLSLLLILSLLQGTEPLRPPLCPSPSPVLCFFCEMYVKRAQKNIPVRGIPLFVPCPMFHVPCQANGIHVLLCPRGQRPSHASSFLLLTTWVNSPKPHLLLSRIVFYLLLLFSHFFLFLFPLNKPTPTLVQALKRRSPDNRK